jgi:hypothetical protein
LLSESLLFCVVLSLRMRVDPVTQLMERVNG